jgi:NADH:ubiquinone oxidoreductase subunit 5 (subunit L)/multisubunit Na+/H+ antiporter MnhA subunit
VAKYKVPIKDGQLVYKKISKKPGNNSIQLFLGWGGVGLAPYLLINFWFTRLHANKAVIKAMLVNQVGDFGLALGIMGHFTIFQTVYEHVCSHSPPKRLF